MRRDLRCTEKRKRGFEGTVVPPAPSANAALLCMGWWTDAFFVTRNDVLQNNTQFLKSWIVKVLMLLRLWNETG